MTETQSILHAQPEQLVLTGHLESHPGGELLRVWCRWCCIWHQHGAAGEGPGTLTEHTAHCYAPDSPYRTYWVQGSAVPYAAAAAGLVVATMAQRWQISVGRITAAVQRLRDQSPPQG